MSNVMHAKEQETIKATLAPGHVIHTLMSEHDMILSFLDELEEVNQTIQKMKEIRDKEILEKLMHIAEHLLDAEPHHKREEEVLFPAVEKRGVFGPPQIMRMEHEELRASKKELKTLAETALKMNFNNFKQGLMSVATSIVNTLREHIFKENNILYPMALQVIQEKEVWDKMKVECDKIGYCCFTPEV